ncbi:MAG TPA: hypothetical protein VFE98_08630 [Candidatus Bathyarchaeia archaeon]|nr:hypothetical protein [Candidatus Bathyarchaeia archaeon]
MLTIREDEYGPEFAGVYSVHRLGDRERKDLLHRMLNAAPGIQYVEDLLALGVTTPNGRQLTKDVLGDLPRQLYLRLLMLSMQLNDFTPASLEAARRA